MLLRNPMNLLGDIDEDTREMKDSRSNSVRESVRFKLPNPVRHTPFKNARAPLPITRAPKPRLGQRSFSVYNTVVVRILILLFLWMFMGTWTRIQDLIRRVVMVIVVHCPRGPTSEAKAGAAGTYQCCRVGSNESLRKSCICRSAWLHARRASGSSNPCCVSNQF